MYTSRFQQPVEWFFAGLDLVLQSEVSVYPVSSSFGIGGKSGSNSQAANKPARARAASFPTAIEICLLSMMRQTHIVCATRAGRA